MIKANFFTIVLFHIQIIIFAIHPVFIIALFISILSILM